MSTQEENLKLEEQQPSISECCSGHCPCEDQNEQNSSEIIFTDEDLKDLPSVISEDNDEKTSDTSQKEEKGSNHILEQFLANLEKLPDAEAKLRFAIEFMEASISQSATPHFKNFWEARKQSLVLFKENINPTSRTVFWNKYIELSDEARRLRDILDEQSAFAAEQIEIAIKAIEDDVGQIALLIEKAPNVEFPQEALSLNKKYEFYNNSQKELNILNAEASRINGLRKELIKTEMRVRLKNKLFQRLSLLGDKIFPRRKDLIKEVSDHFMADVNQFIESNFSANETFTHSLFECREEIKSLQGVAKTLTLNTQSFTHTRMKLSECWDKIKVLEKERKKERSKQKSVFKQNYDEVIQKIKEFTKTFQETSVSVQTANAQIEEIVQLMRDRDLGRDELRHLRSELNEARKLVLDKVKKEEQDRHHHEQEKEKLKKEKVRVLKENIEKLISNVDSYEVDQITSERDSLISQIQEAQISRIEKQDLERLLKPLKDLITEKKERAIMNLSADDQQSLQQLKLILKDRRERRQEIKTQLETYRKASSTSGFDFEKAMQYNVQINEEKERLERINEAIEEIEQKIAELKEKV